MFTLRQSTSVAMFERTLLESLRYSGPTRFVVPCMRWKPAAYP